MKHLFLLALAIAGTVPATAQMGVFSCSQEKATAIDTARYKITYKLDYTCHPQVEERFDDVRTVLIGTHSVKDFSDIIFHYDSLMTADLRRGADSFFNPKGSPWPYEILLSPREKIADIKYRLPDGMNTLHYSESIPEIEWEYTADSTRNILGYNCLKATTEFAGRKYAAWFAPDLPLPFGPYKFGGLPGLILQIQDADRQFVWEAIGFEKTGTPIYVYDYEDEKKCSPKEAGKTIKRCYATPLAFKLSAVGGGKGRIMIVGKDGKVHDATEVEDTPIPYQPLELCDY